MTGEGEEYVSCHANHTTSFSVLLQVTEVQISATHQHILELLTLALTSLSIASLFVTLAILLGFEALRRSERNKIHINMSASLFVAQTVFLVAVDMTNNRILCNVVALLLHYLFLSVFGWMLVQGINLFYMIVKVFGGETSRMRYYFAIGWGLPAIIVGISAGMKFHHYASDDSCWLNYHDGLVWAFAGPAALVVLINTLLLVWIGCILYKSATALYANNDMSAYGIRTSLKGTLLLTPILGTTWAFGYLAASNVTVTFHYIFVIGNCLQGVFIFLICCMFNKEVRDVIKLQLQRNRLEKLDLNSADPINLSEVTETSGHSPRLRCKKDSNVSIVNSEAEMLPGTVHDVESVVPRPPIQETTTEGSSSNRANSSSRTPESVLGLWSFIDDVIDDE